MKWLGYTVNFIPGIDTTEFHFRRYSKWQDVNGILLPAEMVRYKYKNNLPTVSFVSVVNSITAWLFCMFQITPEAHRPPLLIS